MVSQLICKFLFTLTKSTLDKSMAADSPCGDWEPYKDEKCFKVFDKLGTEDEAEKICNQQENNSTLVTIHSKDEQDFLSNLLFKIHKVVDTVWIGAKYSSSKFKWTDDSELSFTNWGDGSPSNTSDKACVQMIPENSSVGKWVNEPCNKNNKVVCQKMQTWSLSRLQKTLLDARKYLTDSFSDTKKELENTKKELENTKKELEDTKKQLNNLQQNPVLPIGFIYVQLPNDKSPSEIWPWMKWNEVSSAYAGVFFRVTGGGAATFGQVQEENSPQLTNVESPVRCNGAGESTKVASNSWSDYVITGNTEGPCGKDRGMRFHISGGEVRPRNMAIRVWKRIG
jgi:hypothetical protein